MEAILSGKPSDSGGVFIIDGDLSAGFELPFIELRLLRILNYSKENRNETHVRKRCQMQNELKVIRK